MQLTKLAAILPILALVSASPEDKELPSLPKAQPVDGPHQDTSPHSSGRPWAPFRYIRDEEKDGSFKLTIDGAERYKGIMGDYPYLGHFGPAEEVLGAYQVQRLKGVPNKETQTYAVMLALIPNLDVAVVQCSVNTTKSIPEDSNAEVIFDVKDPANPSASAKPEGMFADVGCKVVNIRK